MKKIVFLIVIASAGFLSGCSRFLDETPNKSGSAYVYHMDQLYGLMGNYLLYRTGYPWTELISRGDGLDYTPYYYNVARPGEDAYNVWTWDNSYLTLGTLTGTTWAPSYSAIYTCNTVLENMDKVTQTTPSIRKEVEGEALFGRAYHHFIVLVQYCLWNDAAPGLGYRTTTLPTDIPARETVKYTLDKIYEDLDNAEKALTEAGRTKFEIERNFRPTVPTVKAFRARVDLYRGKYASALENANAALAAYSVLVNVKTDPLYRIDSSLVINVLDQTNKFIVGTLKYRTMPDILTKSAEAFSKYPEFYLPHQSDAYFTNRSMPISTELFNKFDRQNDERWKHFFDNNYNLYNGSIPKSVVLQGNTTPTAKCFVWADQQGLPEAARHIYHRFVSNIGSSGKYYILGMTTAEMYLIKAECLARAGKPTEAADALKTLRRTRFTTQASADAIGGTVQEVLDERMREMTELWRFFDIKRLNGAENANITIKRKILTNLADMNSTKDIEIAPNDPRWALPINAQQIILMGWDQN